MEEKKTWLSLLNMHLPICFIWIIIFRYEESHYTWTETPIFPTMYQVKDQKFDDKILRFILDDWRSNLSKIRETLKELNAVKAILFIMYLWFSYPEMCSIQCQLSPARKDFIFLYLKLYICLQLENYVSG